MYDFYPAFSVHTSESDYFEQFSTIRWANGSQTLFLTDRRTNAKLYAYDGKEPAHKLEHGQVSRIEDAADLDEFVDSRAAAYRVIEPERVDRILGMLKEKYFGPKITLPKGYSVTVETSLARAVLVYNSANVAYVAIEGNTPTKILKTLKECAEAHKDKLEDIEEFFAEHNVDYVFTNRED